MSLVASCHCGATQIELPETPTRATECNCTYCSRTGALWAYYEPGEITVRSSADSIYAPSLMNHHFCTVCGMQTWGDAPDWSSIYNADGSPKEGFDPSAIPTKRKFQVNLRLVDGLDWSKIEIDKLDGRNSW
jgi:hypothetical protein